MTKTKSQQAAKAEERPPLLAFVHHQANALEETGKAFASLLPKEFRSHANKAVEEGTAGFNALFDGLKNEVERGVERLKKFGAFDEADEGKVKVEVD